MNVLRSSLEGRRARQRGRGGRAAGRVRMTPHGRGRGRGRPSASAEKSTDLMSLADTRVTLGVTQGDPQNCRLRGASQSDEDALRDAHFRQSTPCAQESERRPRPCSVYVSSPPGASSATLATRAESKAATVSGQHYPCGLHGTHSVSAEELTRPSVHCLLKCVKYK